MLTLNEMKEIFEGSENIECMAFVQENVEEMESAVDCKLEKLIEDWGEYLVDSIKPKLFCDMECLNLEENSAEIYIYLEICLINPKYQ